MDRNMDARPTPDGPQQVTERAKVRAEQTAHGVQREAQQRADEGKDHAAKGAEDMSRAGQRAAQELEAHGHQDLAEGLRFASDKLASFADGLRQRSANDLLRDAEDLARRNPALFMGASLALGFALSRLIKARGDEPMQARLKASGDEPMQARRPDGA